MKSILQSCQISIKLKVARQIFEKSTHLKFHEHPSGRSRCVPCEWMDGPTDRKETGMDLQTDGNDEVNSRFSQSYERA